MSEAGRNCSRCGNILRPGGANCRRCGAAVSSAYKPIADAPASIFLDTIQLRGQSTADARRTGIRPALAVLFRLAVGPAADYYAPRFLSYERAGRGAPGWHWPSFLLPSVWAFYRKLWLAGFTFALLPVAGAFAFAAIADRIDNATLPWLLGAILAIWFLPGVLPAIVANSLVYRRVRQNRRTRRGQRELAPRRWQASWREAVRHRSPRGCCSAAQHCCWRPAWWNPACAEHGSNMK